LCHPSDVTDRVRRAYIADEVDDRVVFAGQFVDRGQRLAAAVLTLVR
jgi:hypothetical protein